MRKVLRFFRLPLTDQWLVMRAVFLVSGVRLALHLFGFPAVYRLLSRFGGLNPEQAFDLNEVQRILRYVDAVSNVLLTRRPCLTRALVAQLLLTRRNFPTTLRLGVSRSAEGKFEAHAWLEHDGRIVIGYLPDLSRFTPLPTLEKMQS